jgi:predicted AlkP superfamily pyrophosphatase or phosphodiesterase
VESEDLEHATKWEDVGEVTLDVEAVLPDYDGACLSNLVPALLHRSNGAPSWLPATAVKATQVVLFLLDGLGWDQLQERSHLTPTLSAMQGGPITSVVPSTTATALTSLTTGFSPARHGVLGYRLRVGPASVMNVLRWSTDEGDMRKAVPPADFQTIKPFAGIKPPVVTRIEFEGGGFSEAHLAGVRNHGWGTTSTLVTNVSRLLADGEPFIYAYYEGIDKVAHEYGLKGPHYLAELAFVDRLVGELIEVLPQGAALVVSSDHGQVQVGNDVVILHPEVSNLMELQSGEGRFRWLHARPGRADALADAARRHHSHQGWVRTRQEAVAEGWFGGELSPRFEARLGDVVLAARQPVAFFDPAEVLPSPKARPLIGRHGSLTRAEMWVPLLATCG